MTDQQQYIIGQFGGQVYMPNAMDVQHGFLWDSITFATGEYQGFVHEFFHTPVGQPEILNGEVKCVTDTNMVMHNKLAPPEAFALQRLVFTFSKEADTGDVTRLVEHCRFQFEIGHKYYLRCPINLLPCIRREFEPLRVCGSPQCKTLYMGDGPCPSCGSKLRPLPLPGHEGEAGRQFFLDLLINLIIDNQATFKCNLFCEVPDRLKLSKPVRMWCHMEGLHARGVQ